MRRSISLSLRLYIVFSGNMFAGGLLGFAAGALTGAATGAAKAIQIGGEADAEIKEILEELSKKARIKNTQ